jgi:hypothetical protein
MNVKKQTKIRDIAQLPVLYRMRKLSITRLESPIANFNNDW